MSLQPLLVPPQIRILLEMERRGTAVDYGQAALGRPVTIRHDRYRKAVRGERPAITLILVGDEVRPDEQQRNVWEVVREMTVDVQVDLDLDTEESGLDPTGLLKLLLTTSLFLRGLRDEEPNSFLSGLCDDIRIGEIDPDDRSQPDTGRMTRAIRVVYRVRADDENVLLAAGANG